jgi:hypothetical protein
MENAPKKTVLPFGRLQNVNKLIFICYWHMQTSSSETLISWKNHLCPSMGPNGGSVAMDSES